MLSSMRRHGERTGLVIDRTIIAVIAGVITVFVVLVGAWLIVTSYGVIGWQVPVASGVAVFTALWVIDFLTDELAKRQQR